MKQFLSFVYKEFCHILRDSRTVLILLVMPIVQIILFGFAISTDVNNVRLAVYDPSNDDATRRIVERFDANRYFSLVETLRTPQQIEEAFRSNRADLALVFEENFQQNLLHGGTGNVQLICDGTDPNTATLVTSYASNILAAYQAELSAGIPAPLQIVPEVKLLYNPQMKGAYNFVPGVMGMILMLICAMMTAISIVREKERGTMEVLLVSPMRPIYIILAKAVPLPRAVGRKPGDDHSRSGLHPAGSGSGQPVLAVGDLTAVRHHGTGARIADLDTRQNAGSRDARFGDGADDAHHAALGHDVSDRKYAGRITGTVGRYPGALVHRSGQKSDDRRTRHHLRAQRGGDPQRNGRRAGRRKS